MSKYQLASLVGTTNTGKTYLLGALHQIVDKSNFDDNLSGPPSKIEAEIMSLYNSVRNRKVKGTLIGSKSIYHLKKINLVVNNYSGEFYKLYFNTNFKDAIKHEIDGNIIGAVIALHFFDWYVNNGLNKIDVDRIINNDTGHVLQIKNAFMQYLIKFELKEEIIPSLESEILDSSVKPDMKKDSAGNANLGGPQKNILVKNLSNLIKSIFEFVFLLESNHCLFIHETSVIQNAQNVESDKHEAELTDTDSSELQKIINETVRGSLSGLRMPRKTRWWSTIFDFIDRCLNGKTNYRKNIYDVYTMADILEKNQSVGSDVDFGNFNFNEESNYHISLAFDKNAKTVSYNRQYFIYGKTDDDKNEAFGPNWYPLGIDNLLHSMIKNYN